MIAIRMLLQTQNMSNLIFLEYTQNKNKLWTLTEATNKSPIFSLVSHSATRDASAI